MQATSLVGQSCVLLSSYCTFWLQLLLLLFQFSLLKDRVKNSQEMTYIKSSSVWKWPSRCYRLAHEMWETIDLRWHRTPQPSLLAVTHCETLWMRVLWRGGLFYFFLPKEPSPNPSAPRLPCGSLFLISVCPPRDTWGQFCRSDLGVATTAEATWGCP